MPLPQSQISVAARHELLLTYYEELYANDNLYFTTNSSITTEREKVINNT